MARRGSSVDEAAEDGGDIGHNSKLSTDQFFALHRDIASAERKKDKAVSDLRTARKRAKDSGLDLAAYDRVKRMAGYTRPELAEELGTIREYAGHMNVPIYSELAEIPQAEELSEDQLAADAENRGYVAGKSGDGKDKNPWDLDTPMGRAWDNGHLRGQKENLPKQK